MTKIEPVTFERLLEDSTDEERKELRDVLEAYDYEVLDEDYPSNRLIAYIWRRLDIRDLAGS